jgi:hypothetical protein
MLSLTLMLFGLGVVTARPSYNTSSHRHPDLLNVHIVGHSHDDSGWLKTVDEYYWGANQTIQVRYCFHRGLREQWQSKQWQAPSCYW